jgi:hypothetical protein
MTTHMWKFITLVVLFLSSTLGTSFATSDGYILLQASDLHEGVGSDGVSTRDCLIVHDDGRFHLERRRQQTPSQTNDLNIYEASLTKNQLDELKALIASSNPAELPTYLQPQYPLSMSSFDLFEVKIAWNGEVYDAGYLDWSTNKGMSPRNPPSDELQSQWRASKLALEPLAKWVKEFEGSQTVRGTFPPNSCTGVE